MTEIRTVTTLIAKRDEIERSIANYEARLEQARADLSHVNACIAIFEACDEPSGTRAYVDLHRLFARGEMMQGSLGRGPKTTKELALIVMAAKGLDTGDKVLARAKAARMIHALRQQWRRGHLDRGWEGEGGAGVGDQVKADSLQKRGRRLLEESEQPKGDSSVHRRGVTRIDRVENIGRRTLGKCDIELSMLSHGQGSFMRCGCRRSGGTWPLRGSRWTRSFGHCSDHS